MELVDVVINLKTNRLNQVYTYIVPDSFEKELFGRRVLVNFGGCKREAFVIGEKITDDQIDLKPILRVLDEQAVFDSCLLRIAEWISERYFCPLPMALNIMLPLRLRKSKSKVVMASINQEEFEQRLDLDDDLPEELFAHLWQEGELSYKKALSIVGRETLEQLEKDGRISIIGDYKAGRDNRSSYVYVPGRELDFNKTIAELEKRAPRQAEIIRLLSQDQELEAETLHRHFPLASIHKLIAKGLIGKHRKEPLIKDPELFLSGEQKEVLERIEEAIGQEVNQEFLLFGITGSGKTEVYIRAAEAALKLGRGVLVLVPEIALTRQLVAVFSSRIPETAVLHSGMTSGERFDEWRRIRNGEARLVLGARSSIFAPISNLGLIIVDEEQENSFKQEETPRYHARDVARYRAQLENSVLLLGSATPSVETFQRAIAGKSQLLSLKNRVGDASLPSIFIEDLRKSIKGNTNQILSPFLQEKIKTRLESGEQSILFINRRGYTPMTICGECGTIALCPFCSVGMTFHNDIHAHLCHYCNHQQAVNSTCQQCGSKHLRLVGAGTQKVEEEVARLFPGARLQRMDLDSSREKGFQQRTLEKMNNKEIDILIGTQMVAKGLDFPTVSLVGVIDADSILNLPDFRAGERCFQLLVQAAGRAGRGQIPGEVVIQTYNPDHPVIQMASRQDYKAFFVYEMKRRKLLEYPPFSELFRIVISSEKEEYAREHAQFLKAYIDDLTDASGEELIMLGPAPCPIAKIRQRFRYQILLKSISFLLLQSIGYDLSRYEIPEGLKIEIELNPMITM